MAEPITQSQDHDRRIGRLEGIAEQLGHRLDSIERRCDSIERAITEQGRQINARLDALTRWLVGIQVASLIAIGSLLLSILGRLPG